MTTETNTMRRCAEGAMLAVFLLATTMTSADCITDLRGEVYCGAGRCIADRKGTPWCSRHYDGDAVITMYGQVLCGKGKCAIDSHGRAFCSAQIGGSVLVDSRGRVRCQGRCAPATAEDCESTIAATADTKGKPDSNRPR